MSDERMPERVWCWSDPGDRTDCEACGTNPNWWTAAGGTLPGDPLWRAEYVIASTYASVIAERDALRAENERLKAVVDAARATFPEDSYGMTPFDLALAALAEGST